MNVLADMHVHSTFSDGRDRIEDNIAECESLGLVALGAVGRRRDFSARRCRQRERVARAGRQEHEHVHGGDGDDDRGDDHGEMHPIDELGPGDRGQPSPYVGRQ